MKDKKKIIITITLASLFVVITAAGFFYVLNVIRAKGDNTALLLDNIQTEIVRRNKIASLNSEIKAIAPERAMLETHFAKSSDVVPFLDTLQALAVKAGAPAEVSSLDLSKEGGGLAVSMKAEGNFKSIHKLLALLQNSPYELDFSSVKIERKTLSDKEALAANDTIWIASFKLTLVSFSSEL